MKSILKLCINCVDRVNGLVGGIAAIMTIFMVANVFVVVVLRYAFSTGHIWMQELYVWFHAAIFLGASGYTLRDDGHVRIDLIYSSRSSKFKAVINLIGSVVFALPFLVFLFKWTLPIVIRSWHNLERSSEVGGLPGLYVLKACILFFCISLGIQVTALMARCLLTLFFDENHFPEDDHKIGAIVNPLPVNRVED